MKANHFFIGILITAASCQKERETAATTVQLKTTEYFSGDTLANVSFQIKEPYTESEYGITDSTNAHGFYFGSFEHPINKSFEVEVNSHYLNLSPKIQLNSGQHNVVDLVVVDPAILKLELDCTGAGPGVVQNVQCVPTVNYDYTSPLNGLAEGMYKNFGSECGEKSIVKLLSGEWIIRYDWKPDLNSNVWWTQKTDTIQLAPGQEYNHTIVY